jgi:hypothetical protein
MLSTSTGIITLQNVVGICTRTTLGQKPYNPNDPLSTRTTPNIEVETITRNNVVHTLVPRGSRRLVNISKI